MNWEAIGVIAAIVLPVATALAFIAYKHPAGYQRIVNPVVKVLLIGCGAVFLFSGCAALIGIDVVIDRSRSSPDATLETVAGALTNVENNLMTMWYTLVVWLVVFGYLVFLEHLPSLLKDEKAGD